MWSVRIDKSEGERLGLKEDGSDDMCVYTYVCVCIYIYIYVMMIIILIVVIIIIIVT